MTYSSDPNQPFPPDVSYYTPSSDSGPKHLRLVAIFNYISAALDICLGLILLGLGILLTARGGSMPQNPGDPPPQLLGAIYGAMGFPPLAFAVVKFIAIRKLKSGEPKAWGWGLA